MPDTVRTGLPRVDVLDQLRSGAWSSRELTERYVTRIAEDESVNAFVTVADELAFSQAKRADDALADGAALGPLHGLPVAIKDNIDVAGVRATMGSRFYADRLATEDATAVQRLTAAGAVILGKTALHEFAYGVTTQNRHFGEPCRNPWDVERIPGGSSGGSGAAVAADQCPAALGTDTGGSVRIPAALNGVTGLRPTTGRISMNGVFPITWTFDTVGPMARSVRDVALLYAVLAGHDGVDPLSENVPVEDALADLEGSVEGLRVAVPERFYQEDAEPEVVGAVHAAADLLADLGAEVDAHDLPGAADAAECTTRTISAEALAIHRERLEERPGDFGEDVRARLELGRSISGADYAGLRQQARTWQRTVQRTFERFDVVLTPTTRIVAPRADEDAGLETTWRLTRLTYGWTLAGTPVLALPCGLGGAGMPVGMQLAAAPWQEATLLRLGHAYQRATDWHLRRPATAPTPDNSRGG